MVPVVVGSVALTVLATSQGPVLHQSAPLVTSQCVRDGTGSLCWRETDGAAGRVVSPATLVALKTGLQAPSGSTEDGRSVLAGVPYHGPRPVNTGTSTPIGMRALANAYRAVGAGLAGGDYGDVLRGGGVGFVLNGGSGLTSFPAVGQPSLSFQGMVVTGTFTATGTVNALVDGGITGRFNGFRDSAQLGPSGWSGGVGFRFTYRNGDLQLNWVEDTGNLVDPAGPLAQPATLTPQDLAKWGRSLLGALVDIARRITEPPVSKPTGPADPGPTTLVGAHGSGTKPATVGRAVSKPDVPAKPGGTSNPPANPGTGSGPPPAGGGTGTSGSGSSGTSTPVADSGGSGSDAVDASDESVDPTADDPAADSESADPDGETADAEADTADDAGPDAADAGADASDASSAGADSDSAGSADSGTGASSDGAGDSGDGGSGDGGSGDGGSGGGDGGSGGGDGGE